MADLLFVVTALKLLTEIALLALLGRGVLSLMTRRSTPDAAANPFAWVLDTLCKPPLWIARQLMPRTVPVRLHAWMAAVLMTGLWLAATVAKIQGCLDAGMDVCR